MLCDVFDKGECFFVWFKLSNQIQCILIVELAWENDKKISFDSSDKVVCVLFSVFAVFFGDFCFYLFSSIFSSDKAVGVFFRPSTAATAVAISSEHLGYILWIHKKKLLKKNIEKGIWLHEKLWVHKHCGNTNKL